MLRESLLLPAVAALVACAAETERNPASAQDVTVAQVLASPGQFNGKRISLVGYYVVANEESCLFTTRGAAKREEPVHCIWIDFHAGSDLTSIADRRARIVGTFRYTRGAASQTSAGHREHTLLWPYLLQDVMSFRPVR